MLAAVVSVSAFAQAHTCIIGMQHPFVSDVGSLPIERLICKGFGLVSVPQLYLASVYTA